MIAGKEGGGGEGGVEGGEEGGKKAMSNKCSEHKDNLRQISKRIALTLVSYNSRSPLTCGEVIEIIHLFAVPNDHIHHDVKKYYKKVTIYLAENKCQRYLSWCE